MPEVFISVINLSINAGWLVLAIILLRLIFKRIPKFLFVIMWGLVGIRLIFPFSVESFLSLLPSAEAIPQNIIFTEASEIHSGIPIFNAIINPVISEAVISSKNISPVKSIASVLTFIWLSGIIIMLVYGLISYIVIKRKVREGILTDKNIFICDHIPSPFILGIFSPKIYVPSYCNGEELKYVIAHEKAHLKRLDHFWKPLGFLLLSIYWFNPLLWVAYVLLCRDIESACDEKVIKTLGADTKKEYSTVLVNFSHHRKIISACPVAFGEADIKSRVKSILSYKKPVFWVIILSVLLIIVLAIGFLTNPRTKLNDRLQVFIDCQIAEHHQGKFSPDVTYSAVDYEILGINEDFEKVTLYAWVLYQEYTFESGQIKKAGGAHTPTVITAKKVDDDYKLIEYWTPRDGSYYPEDIKEKFPFYLVTKALDSQRYIDKQQNSCDKMAEEYFASYVSGFGGVNGPENTMVSIDNLKKKYPEFFNFDSIRNVRVYMWEQNDKYVCTFFPETVSVSIESLRISKAVPLEEGRILSTAYIQSELTVFAIKNPHTTNALEYCEGKSYIEMKHSFFKNLTKGYFPSYTQVSKSFTLDIDKDGKDEACTVFPGSTSGLFTFKIRIYEDNEFEYENTFISEVFSEFCFDFSRESYFVARKSDGSIICYEITFKDGNIYLTNNGESLLYLGEQDVNTENKPLNFDIIVKK